MDELACCAPGMLVLGIEGAPPEKAKEYFNLAEELPRTCYNMYMSTPTKPAGDFNSFDDVQVYRLKYNYVAKDIIWKLSSSGEGKRACLLEGAMNVKQ